MSSGDTYNYGMSYLCSISDELAALWGQVRYAVHLISLTGIQQSTKTCSICLDAVRAQTHADIPGRNIPDDIHSINLRSTSPGLE